MALDFNDADRQRDEFDLIPAGTIVKLAGTIRPGASGDGGWLTRSKSGDGEYINWEFVVISPGKWHNRRVWQNMSTSGGKLNEKGESIAWNISKAALRAMLNSARRVKPDDDGEAARKARVITGWQELQGIEFVARIGIEKGTQGYPDKNKIQAVIEPGYAAYDAVMNGGEAVGGAAGQVRTAASGAAAPAWAQQPNGGGASQPQQQPAQAQPAPSNLPAWAR